MNEDTDAFVNRNIRREPHDLKLRQRLSTDESRVKPQPLQPEELKALSEWLALGPNFTLSAHVQRRLIATIEEARIAQPVRVAVHDSMIGEAAAAWCRNKYGYAHPVTMTDVSRSPEMAAAVEAAVAEYNRLVRTGAIQLAAAPKEGGE